jgi:hypothetical protein
MTGICFAPELIIYWNGVPLQTFYCFEKRSLHCFSLPGTMPVRISLNPLDIGPSNFLYSHVTFINEISLE